MRYDQKMTMRAMYCQFTVHNSLFTVKEMTMRTIVLFLSALIMFSSCTFVIGDNNESDGIHLGQVKVVPTGRVESKPLANLGHFDEIEVNCAIHVLVTDSVEVPTIQADAALMPYVYAQVKEHTLIVEYNKGLTLESDGATLLLPTLERIESIELNGATSLRCEKPITNHQISFELNGASQASCKFDMPLGELDIELTGASSLYASGLLGELEAELHGASSLQPLDEEPLEITNADVELIGASSATFRCTQVLEGELHGASTLNYGGHPSNVKVSAVGVSSVNPIEL